MGRGLALLGRCLALAWAMPLGWWLLFWLLPAASALLIFILVIRSHLANKSFDSEVSVEISGLFNQLGHPEQCSDWLTLV